MDAFECVLWLFTKFVILRLKDQYFSWKFGIFNGTGCVESYQGKIMAILCLNKLESDADVLIRVVSSLSCL